MTMHGARTTVLSTQLTSAGNSIADRPFIELDGQGFLSFKSGNGSLEFCYWSHPPAVSPASLLPAAMIEAANGAVLDPALSKVIVRIAPYPDMASGDKLQLSWAGLDTEGFTYRHEAIRYVSEGQVGKEVVFVINGTHIAALDGGSLEVYWTLVSASLPAPSESARLQLSVGDVASHLPAPYIEDASTGSLDPERIIEGLLVKLQPYPRMAAGDRIELSWQYDSSVTFNDALTVESFTVGEVLSFWLPSSLVVAEAGDELTISYRVDRMVGAPGQSVPLRVTMVPTVRGVLDAPDVLEAVDGVLQVEDSLDGITVVIGNAQAQDGELVYLKCDGDLFSYRDEREVSREMSGEPLVFVVPARFWREHQGSTVRVAYTVERNDDFSQLSEETRVKVE
ncbi:hypothetical protein [Pseudomonas atagonensis]|uniref:hypothetical protein n=1 Tax=Pseudomonas atagonensis TaxID=2609964 RepID=UPI001FEAF09E|nr:hypothetical protein [Pseudomonas atagonensis]